MGASDQSDKARKGLASGLRHVYFPGLETTTLDWLGADANGEVTLSLFDHMAAQVERCPAYQNTVVEAYTRAGIGSLERTRLEAASQATPVFRELKKIALTSESYSLFGDSLFSGANPVVNINARDVAIGVVAGGGATVSGSVTNTQSHVENAQKNLDDLLKLLPLHFDEQLSKGALLVQEAKKNTTPSTLQNVVDWMKGIKDLGIYAVSSAASFEQIYHLLETAAKHWPS